MTTEPIVVFRELPVNLSQFSDISTVTMVVVTSKQMHNSRWCLIDEVWAVFCEQCRISLALQTQSYYAAPSFGGRRNLKRGQLSFGILGSRPWGSQCCQSSLYYTGDPIS